jgi:Ca2+-binding EF-hand superfamily protein
LEAFDLFRESDGWLDLEQLEQLTSALDMNMERDQVDALREAMDPEDQGRVRKEAFMRVMRPFFVSEDHVDEVDEHVRSVYEWMLRNVPEHDRERGVSLEVLESASQQLQQNWTQDELRDMMQVACGRVDGTISFAEFTELAHQLGMYG